MERPPSRCPAAVAPVVAAPVDVTGWKARRTRRAGRVPRNGRSGRLQTEPGRRRRVRGDRMSAGPTLHAAVWSSSIKNIAANRCEFLAIDSNQQDSLAEIAHFAESHKVAFPVKKDPGNKVADLFGATRTPEAFVLDREGVIRYAGLIDDQFGIGYAHDKPKRRFVEDALGDLLAGREVRVPATAAIGCRIGRINRRPPTGNVTYTNQIARILETNCVTCHRAGKSRRSR